MTGLPTKDDMLARARALAPRLVARAEECERNRSVPEASIADFLDGGFHRMLQPKRYGGLELGWDALVETTLEFAQGCGSQAWVFTVYGDHAQMLGLFAPEAQDDIWADDPRTLVSTSFQPLGKVARKNGGYVLSGQWPFSSGIDHARWLVAGAILDGRHVYFLVPKNAARIVDDWHVAGLSGTGSKSFAIDQAFVPPHRMLAQADALAGAGPGAAFNTAPIYRFPRRAAGTALGAVPIGVATAMLDRFCVIASDRAKRGRRAGADPVTGLKIAETASDLDCARWLVVDSARRLMAALDNGGTPSAELRATVRRNQAYAAMLACRSAERILALAGGTALYLSNPMQRAFRDVHVATQHHSVAWDIVAAPYGAMRLGRALDLAAI